ncbi:MAG: hypothetical protein U0S49_14595 [Rhodospirillales bacterium]|nr:hypothetical protein [Rhodospirillales bacterium]
MEVATSSYALEQARERFAQPRQHLASQTNAERRLIDMPCLKAVDKTSVPALPQRCWPAIDVEHSRKMLQVVHTRMELTNQSIEHWSKSIKTAEELIMKYGPTSPLLAMMDSAKAALNELAAQVREENFGINQLTTELNEKIAAPAYQQWLSRQAQSCQAYNGQDSAATTCHVRATALSVVC